MPNEEQIMYIFPGQGSQYEGMGSDVYKEYIAAKRVYDTASEVLGYDVAELSFRGPEEKLTQTRFTQPALLTHCMACFEVFNDITDGRMSPITTAGHSLGEYAALIAAGSLTFESALKLVQERGNLMGTYGRGEMCAFPLDLETIRPHAERHYCGIGGCNLPDQTVVGGQKEDLDLIAQEVRERYGKNAVHLKTEGAFHTYLMIKAAEEYRSFLSSADISPPRVRVLSNYTGSYHEPDPATIKSRLFFQLFNPVKWIWGLQRALGDGVTALVEFGGGIGRGEQPDAKRPNLESIVRKTLRASNHSALYLPAINCRTIKKAAHFFRGMWKLSERRNDDLPSSSSFGVNGNAVDENWFHLLVPTQNGIVTKNSVALISLVNELGLSSVVQIIREKAEENLENLRRVMEEPVKDPQPHLEKIVGSETASIQEYYGAEIENELIALKRRLDTQGYIPSE
jgi:malonyl CoA-acyl carrier protein transacylase